MSNIGIICSDNINEVGHSLFNNFRLALTNHLNTSFIEVSKCEDLLTINTLIIVDEHYEPNTRIWRNDNFIRIINDNNINVIVFNFEKIYNSQFPWNVDHQNRLLQIKKLTQIVSDIDDAKILNHNIINKQYLSKNTQLTPTKEKIERIVFIGQCNNFYPTRKNILLRSKELELPLDIIITDRKLSYTEFLETLSKYKYVLNPLGTGKFLNLRFYEALKQGCIPIQEITYDMRSWYKELDNCIWFENVNDIKLKLEQQPPVLNYYLEDYLDEINFKALI
jgi:hypothetical protein